MLAARLVPAHHALDVLLLLLLVAARPARAALAAGCRLGRRAGRAPLAGRLWRVRGAGRRAGHWRRLRGLAALRAGHLVLGVAPRADYHCHIYGGRVRTSCSPGCGRRRVPGSRAPARRLLCVQRVREGAGGRPGWLGGAGWLRLVSFSFFVSAFAKFCRWLVWPGVFVLFVSLGSALLLSGGFPPGRGGDGAGGEQVRAERGERERGRGGRAASRLSGFKTEVGGKKKKKSLQRSSSLSLSPSLSRSLSRSQSWCVAEELEEEEEEERRLSGGQVQGSPQSAIQESHRNREDSESRGAGLGRAQRARQAGAEAGGPRSGRSAARVQGNQHESGPRRALSGVVLALGRRRRLPRAPRRAPRSLRPPPPAFAG